MAKRSNLALTLLLLATLAGCDEEKGSNERRTIRERDLPSALAVVRRDLNNGVTGVRRAADMLAPRFSMEDEERKEREMRQVLQRVQRPPRAIEQLMLTPVSFVAAVRADGHVIARDADEDRMRGFDLAAAAPVVRRALEQGEAGYELSELPSLIPDEPPSITIIFAAPARHEGQIVGAVAAGLPLWRLTQQLSRQLQLENAQELQRGHLVWIVVYRGADLHPHMGFPPGLADLAPDAAARAEGLRASPGGYTGEVQQYGRWYGYAVIPLPTIAPDIGMILFRSDPF